jgi:hypothetical protein
MRDGLSPRALGSGPRMVSTYKGNFAVDWLQIQRRVIDGAMFGCSSRRLKRDPCIGLRCCNGLHTLFLSSRGYLLGQPPEMRDRLMVFDTAAFCTMGVDRLPGLIAVMTVFLHSRMTHANAAAKRGPACARND